MDVAVVGAGPSGAWAAARLAAAGARVTVFDPSHPREKPCGGGVTGRALALVAGAIDPPAFARTTIRTARFTRLRGVAAPARPADVGVVALHGDALVVASRAALAA